MGCGIADFGRRGLKTPQTQDFWVFILSPGTLTRGAGDLDSQRRGPRLAAPRDLDWRRESSSHVARAQRVPEPDPIPGISFDTRPDPIQF